jgi:hypothetical protein
MLSIRRTSSALFLCAAVSLTTACGGGTSDAPADNSPPASTTPTSSESYINYLSTHYDGYVRTGTTENPVADYDDKNMSLRWTISGQTTEEAENLKKHIEFMVHALESGQNPRPWDKLFLMDAYMDQQHAYHTTVSLAGRDVVIDKVATEACAYQMLKTHAVGVSGKFFEGDIKVSFTPLAEQLIASPVCDADRAGIEAYIDQHLEPLPDGITLVQ